MRMMIRRMILKLFWLIVILNPYDGIDYDEPNVYYITSDDYEIIVTEPEKEKQREPKIELQFCFLCNPPQFIPLEM